MKNLAGTFELDYHEMASLLRWLNLDNDFCFLHTNLWAVTKLLFTRFDTAKIQRRDRLYWQ